MLSIAMAKRVWKIVGGVVAAVVVSAGGFVGWNVHAFDASMQKVYDVPLPKVDRSTDEAVIARGKHLTESVGACSTADCHGADLAGGRTLAMGPVATLAGPNITAGGKRAAATRSPR